HPFAEFSPEWQAMLWATRHARTVRFIDEPLTARAGAEDESDDADADADTDDGAHEDEPPSDPIVRDPLTHLAVAAGHSDGEAWWNALIEQHMHAPEIFASIESAMTALRSVATSES